MGDERIEIGAMSFGVDAHSVHIAEEATAEQEAASVFGGSPASEDVRDDGRQANAQASDYPPPVQPQPHYQEPEQTQYQAPAQPQPQYQAPQYQQPPQPQGQYGNVQVQVGTALPSPLSLGWEDVAHAPSPVSSLGTKALIGCVPVLDFCLYGLAGRWGREPVDGTRSPLPVRTVSPETFTSGFFYFVITLAIAFALGIVNVFPFIGQLICLAGSVIALPVAILMYYRYLSYGSFAEAWNLADIWDKASRAPGSLWVSACVPGLVAGAAGILGAGVVASAFLLGGAGAMASFAVTGAIPGAVLSVFLIGVGILLAAVIVMGAGAIGLLWGFRACGHWLARYAPEWSRASIEAERARARAVEGTVFTADTQSGYYEVPQQVQQPYQAPVEPQEEPR